MYVSIPPKADAGGDQSVDPGALLTLDGSGSHGADGDPLTYGWKQIGGEAVVLSESSAVTPTFLAPLAPGPLTFSLTVTDSWGLTDRDTTVVLVRYPIPVGGATQTAPQQRVLSAASALAAMILVLLLGIAASAAGRRGLLDGS